MEDQFSGVWDTRPARAVAPTGDLDGLRRAYLDLLKLSLCDLAGARTVSVGKLEDGSVASRELSGDDLRFRVAGMDWPRQGLTMVGLYRLDDLEARVEAVVREGIEGDLIEAGAWRGGASILMRATLDTLGAGDRTVWVADSFRGFPEADRQEGLNAADFLSVPLEEAEANFARFGLDRGVTFVPGFFEDTMADLAGHRWSVVRLDGDTYEATWLTLESLYPGLSVGGHLIVDDYRALDECRRAVDDFRAEHGIDEPLEQVDWTCVAWRKEHERPVHPAERTQPGGAARRQVRTVERGPEPHVPTMREIALQEELEQLRANPLAGPRQWLSARLRRRSAR